MSISARLQLDPARRLVFSPAWGEGRVVFDARSGDFWVVSEAVYNALRVAAGEGLADGTAPSDIDAATLDHLSNQGIIRSPNSN